MRKNEIVVGATYLAKVTNKTVPVRIDRENPHGGWDATNMATNKSVRIKSAQRLKGPAGRAAKDDTKNAVKVADAAPVETPAEVAPKAKPAKEPKAAKAPKTPKAAKAPKAAKEGKKLSAIDAAAKLLAESAEPMTTGELIEEMAAKGLWTSPGGKTPAATLYSAILREMKAKGADARFTKAARGKFALAAAK